MKYWFILFGLIYQPMCFSLEKHSIDILDYDKLNSQVIIYDESNQIIFDKLILKKNLKDDRVLDGIVREITKESH